MPLSREDYCASLLAHDVSQEAAESVLRLLPDEARAADLREALEAMTPERLEQGYPGLLIMARLNGVDAWLRNPTVKLFNWHHDRTAGVFLGNLKRGVHEALSAALLRAYQPDLANGYYDADDAEAFLEQGLGWFRSSSSYGRMLKGENVVLTAQEKLAFRSQTAF